MICDYCKEPAGLFQVKVRADTKLIFTFTLKEIVLCLPCGMRLNKLFTQTIESPPLEKQLEALR